MLAAGTRLGPYEIETLLGAGGMGQVYKARDTRLGRTVALKILSADIAADPAFRERFEREARAISGLDHPHICALYDVGTDQGTDFLVMQFLEGETLAARIGRGALPPDEALRYGSQIADALAAAHRRGIVHRDLKPANVMLTKSGVKLLDFGIASLALADRVAPGPTRTNPLTGQGVLLGTLQYMSPEQLEGKGVDARSDIWALGTVIYEMLTGTPAFSGGSQASVIGAILHSVPAPVSASRALTPPAVDRVVAKCLNKDPDERWQSAHDVGDELRWIAGNTGEATSPPALALPAPTASGWPTRAVAGALIVALASIAFAAWTWRATRPSPGTAYRLGLPLPEGAEIEDGIALSPDGRWLAFSARPSGQPGSVLWIRAMDSFDARPIAGTDGARFPFWSPDSRHIGFFAGTKLRRVAIAGGSPLSLADVAIEARGGTWNRDNVIVFAASYTTGLSRVSADGGEVRPLTTLTPPAGTHRWPHFLPDGRHYLFLVRGGSSVGAEAVREVMVGSLDGGEPSRLLSVESSVVFAPPGHLLYMHDTMLMAQAFSAQERRLTGEPFMVADRVLRMDSALGIFSAAGGGLLVYSADDPVVYDLAWFDRGGKRLGAIGTGGASEMWLSPDQADAVLYRNGDLWIANLARGTTSRFTSDETEEVSPVWSPDGKWIVYTAGQMAELHARLATGGGATQLLLKVPGEEVYADDWSRDNGHLLFERIDGKRQTDIWAMPSPVLRADGTLAAAGQPFPVLNSHFIEAHSQFSPDGRWIAYASNESGQPQIYVQSFPPGKGKWPISTDGGDQPTWRRDGRELYYINADKRLVAVDVRTAPSMKIGAATTLFQTTVVTTGLLESRNNYVASGDGRRFLVSSAPPVSSSKPLRVVFNWASRAAQ